MHGEDTEEKHTPQNGNGVPQNGSHASQTGSNSKKHQAYMKLMGEDLDDGAETDALDMAAADKIIEESRQLHSGTDTEVSKLLPASVESQDIEATPPKRKRGRPRKGETSPKKADLEPRRNNSKRAAAEKSREAILKFEEEELQARRSRSARKAKRTPIVESSENEESFDEEDEEFKVTATSPTEKPSKPSVEGVPKRTRTPTKRKISDSPTPSPASERRTKKGRPSKQENITKKVLSIFHMDDIELFPDRAQSPPTKASVESPKSPNKISLNFDNTGQSKYSGTPLISGIRKPMEEETKSEVVTKFVPMPVPALDADGNIADPEFLPKHLSDVAINLGESARLTDERAFFLEGSEGYFEQHNLRFRPSSSSLAANAPEISYEEFIPYIKLSELVYKGERDALHELHKDLYHQWCFELSQGYSLNFYGIGSKANLIMEFVETYFMDWYQDTIQDEAPPSVMVINGYNPATKLKTIIHDIVSLLVTPEERKSQNLRMPKHVSEALPFLMSYLKKNIRRSPYNGIVKATLVLVIHNIDGDAFRDTRSQNYLSQLASLPNVWLVVSTDNINSSLLWDLYRFKNFNFLWHNVTTYDSYAVEMSFRDVLSMGKSKKFVGSKGAQYVLTSLTPNARSLYEILLQMQLANLKEATTSQAGRTGLRGSVNTGMELRAVYETCVDKFVASNEINFKTMLGEFVEHKMCVLSKNARGTETVHVPFTFDEMEKLLESKF